MSSKKNSGLYCFDNHVFSVIRKRLKEKIIHPEVREEEYVKERQHLLDLLKRTVELGESNSALLIGPRGCGKTTLMNHVISELSLSQKFKSNVIMIHLNGLIHTDDRLALKDIARQMKLENVVENKVFGTFAENFNFLLDCLKSGDKKTSMPCIFLIDEFELFCNHHNQALIYNLFDVAQSAQTPICVLGITCRLDVIELLEKRVKSRFSHRQIFLFPKNSSDTDVKSKNETKRTDFDDRIDLLYDLLTINENDIQIIEQENKKLKINSQVSSIWNKNIDEIISNNNVVKLMKQMYQLDVNERSFRNFLFVLISILNINHQKIMVNDFIEASKLFLCDDKISMLEGLSVLELSLIIAMKHETEIFDGEPFNFESIVKRYVKFANQTSSIQSVQRPVIMKAFEHLKNLELLIPMSSNNSKIEKEYQYFKLFATSHQVLEAVKNYPGLPTEVAQWATNSLQ